MTEPKEEQGREESSQVPNVSTEQAVPGFQELDGNGVRGEKWEQCAGRCNLPRDRQRLSVPLTSDMSDLWPSQG